MILEKNVYRFLGIIGGAAMTFWFSGSMLLALLGAITGLVLQGLIVFIFFPGVRARSDVNKVLYGRFGNSVAVAPLTNWGWSRYLVAYRRAVGSLPLRIDVFPKYMIRICYLGVS